jgi:aspartate racemase
MTVGDYPCQAAPEGGRVVVLFCCCADRLVQKRFGTLNRFFVAMMGAARGRIPVFLVSPALWPYIAAFPRREIKDRQVIPNVQTKQGSSCYGIVGGLGGIAGADLLLELARAVPAGAATPEFIFEQRRFAGGDSPGDRSASQDARQFYVYDMICGFSSRPVEAVVLPCFLSHSFIDELQAEVALPIINMMDALVEYVASRHPGVRRLGVLTSDYSRSKNLFERYFSADRWQLVYPADALQNDGVMAAIYGAGGVSAGCRQGVPLDLLSQSCADLVAQGAELIVPGMAEIALVVDALIGRGFPIFDANPVYARYALSSKARAPARQYKIGIVGGVGPAATVDFVDKIVRNTRALRDQDHVKLVVEQNPQIPDRTGFLLGDGVDPTLALYSTCKKLEADAADFIAIPCNTAHAYIDRIQPHLSIPIVNMLFETVEHIRRSFSEPKRIGLLATNGTLKSGVYHREIEKAGFELVVPDEANQARVMRVIYGAQGAKAGFTTGECVDDLLLALTSLVEHGAEVILLGCTELPLLMAQNDAFPVAGKTVVVLDPTEILARKCVSLCQGAGG